MSCANRRSRRRSGLRFVVCALLAVLTEGYAVADEAPVDDRTRAPYPVTSWPEATPRARGMDPAPLTELVATLRAGETIPDIHGLLVIKDGYLVTEAYFDGWNADRKHTLQSVSKSVTSALVGIAVARGVLRDVEERILDFFPWREEVEHLDSRKRAIRIEDLLTMRSGTDYTEGFSGSPHSRLNALDRGWDRFYLDRPMLTWPGRTFRYDSGGVILISSLIEARTGAHADAFAARHLFAPLGILDVRWSRNRERHPHMGGGLHLRPRDMARFALLYLRGGRWRGQQVIPESWVRESTRPHLALERPARRVTGYGYLWWIHAPAAGDGLDIVAAHGFMGQYIFLVPEHDLAVVVTAGARGAGQRAPIEFLYSHVLPAVRAGGTGSLQGPTR